eukprot:GHVH01000427.1.p1 GENE.GHVH01000427.1~~GHVH01000427.1.p1  ORF type:complete len:1762 (+),score=393.47 GHVH01000427.1:313-5598(+)
MYGYPNVPSSFSSPAHSTVKKPKSSVTFNDDLPVDDAPPFSLASSRNLKDETHETKSGAHHSGGFVSTLLSLASHRYPSHPKPTSNSVNFNDETFEQTEGRINEPVNEPSTKTIDQSESITAWNPSQGVQSSSMNGVNNNGGIAKLSMVMFEDLTQDDPTHEQELSIGNSTTQSTPGGVLKKTTVNYAQRAVEGTIEGAVKSSSDDVVTADEVNNPIVSTLQTERLPPEGAPTRRHKRHHNSEDRQNAPKSDEIKKKKNKKSTSRNVKLSSANKTIKRSEEKDTKVKDTKVKETSKMAMKMASGVANSLLNVRSTDKKSTTSLTGVDDKKKMPRNPSSPSSTTNSQKTKSNHKSSSSETAAAGVLQPNECEEGGVVSEKTELIRAAETDVDPLVAPPISHAEAYPKMTTIQIAAPSSPRDVYVATSLTPSIKDDLDSAHASRNEPEGKKKKKGIRLGVGKKKKKSVQGSQDTEIEGPAAVRIRELEEELAQMADDILDEQRRIDENWAELEIERENISNAKKAMDKDLLRREEEIEGRRNLLETQLGQVAEQSEMIQTERLQLDKMKNALTQSEVNHGGDDSGGGSGGGRDIADLRNQLHIQMENTKELEQELEDTRSVMLELERDAERYESNWMKEVEESKQLKSELLNLTPNSQRMADSSEGLMHSKEIKEALETRICDLEVQLSDALRYKETVTSELEALKATNESQVEALTMMTARKVESERSLNQQVISLKDALDAMENENLSLVANNKKMQGQISESEGGHHRRAEEGELDAIKAERDSLLTEVEELKLTLKHREDRFDEEDNRKRGSSFPVWTASVSSDGDSFTEGYKKKNDKVVCDRISELEEKLMAANKQLEQYAEAKNSLMDSPTSSASRNHPTGGGLPDLSRVLSISKKEREKTSRADLEQQLEHYKELATCLQSAFLELNNASIRADAIGNGLQCPSDEDIAPPEADVPVIVYKIANSLMENAHNRTSSKGSKTNNADSVPGGMTTAEIDDLLESHENEITTLEQSLDKAKARLGVAELDLKEKQELCEHRALEIDQLKTKLITKSEEIEEKTTLLTSKDLEISHFVTQMKELTEKEAEGQDEVKNLEVEIVNLRRELEGLHSELNNDQKDMASKLSDSLQKNTELEKTIAKHETEINKLETSIDDLEIEIKQNRESFTQLQHERSDSVSAYNTLENEHMHLKQKKREVEDDLEASCQTIKSLESDKKELDTEMKALSKEVKSLEKALDKVQGEMKKKTSKTHDQSDVISKLENELEDAKAELSAKESSNLLLNEMIEKKHDEVDEQQSTVDTLTNQLEALKSKHEQVKIELDTITEEWHAPAIWDSWATSSDECESFLGDDGDDVHGARLGPDVYQVDCAISMMDEMRVSDGHPSDLIIYLTPPTTVLSPRAFVGEDGSMAHSVASTSYGIDRMRRNYGAKPPCEHMNALLQPVKDVDIEVPLKKRFFKRSNYKQGVPLVPSARRNDEWNLLVRRLPQSMFLTHHQSSPTAVKQDATRRGSSWWSGALGRSEDTIRPRSTTRVVQFLSQLDESAKFTNTNYRPAGGTEEAPPTVNEPSPSNNPINGLESSPPSQAATPRSQAGANLSPAAPPFVASCPPYHPPPFNPGGPEQQQPTALHGFYPASEKRKKRDVLLRAGWLITMDRRSTSKTSPVPAFVPSPRRSFVNDEQMEHEWGVGPVLSEVLKCKESVKEDSLYPAVMTPNGQASPSRNPLSLGYISPSVFIDAVSPVSSAPLSPTQINFVSPFF